ncbi:MAG: hypothetical protein ACTHXL_11755, partial [Microbacterium gubbeenense]
STSTTRRSPSPRTGKSLINGVFYYQIVVRGASMADPDTLARCREAFEVAWRGMSADPSEGDVR